VLDPGKHASEVRHHQLEWILHLVGGFPFAHEIGELPAKIATPARGGAARHAGEEIDLHPALVEHRFANQDDPGVEQIADHRLAVIKQAPGCHDPEIRQHFRQLENTVRIINLENDGIPLDPKEVSRQLRALAIAAGNDALG